VVEQLIEIPFPGRSFTAPAGDPRDRRPSARLPSFVAGPENRVVASTILRVMSASQVKPPSAEAGVVAPTLLALHGASGAGKTHLARGLVEYWQLRRGPESAEYVNAIDFRRAFLDALDDDSLVALRRRFRQRELVAIDDLQQLPNTPFLMQELRNTLDEYHEAGRFVVVTSSRAPATLGNLSADVRSRLAGGLFLRLGPPAAAARLQIVEQATAALGRPLSTAAARRIADAVSGNANELFAALFELLCGPPIEPNQPGPELAEVDDLLAARAQRKTSLREIIAVVSRYFRLPQKLLKSSSRKQSVVTARATVVYLARELAGISYEQIGRALGGRDHSTIMHNYHTIQRDRQRDWQTQETLDELRRILTSS
jgi:chromosomal replication initiator protein